MTSPLHSKINSYAIEKGIEFGNGVSWPEIETGSLAQSQSNQWTLTGSLPTSDSDSPVGGDNSKYWYFDTPRRQRISTTGGSWMSAITDHSYSLGFWFKIPTATYLADSQVQILTINPFTAGGTGFQIFSPQNTVGFPERTTLFLAYSTSSTNVAYVPLMDPIGFDQWYYFSVIREGANATFYIDGISVLQISNMLTATQPTGLTFGGPGIVGTSPVYRGVKISNLYIAPTNIIGPTEIAEINSVGQYGLISNKDLLVDAVTADAVLVNPSVGSSVQIETTALISSAQIVNAIVSVIKNFVTPIGMGLNIASATMVDPIINITIDVSISLTGELNATALMSNAIFAGTTIETFALPITASADIASSITIISDEQSGIFATALTATATIVNPPSIVSNDEVIFVATPIIANAEIPNPGYGTPQLNPLYWTAGTLQSKIATYAIQHGTEFNGSGAFSTNTSYGTSPANWTSYSKFDSTGFDPVYEAGDGPFASGTGCWKFGNTRVRTVLQSGITSDLNYTTGIWFKLPTLPTGTANEGMRLFTLGTSTVGSTSIDYSVSVTGSSHATQPSKLAISLNGTSYDYLTTTLNTTEWYYIAIKRTGSSGVNNFEVYINGELKLVKTNSDTSATYTYFHIGNNGVSANGGSIKFQNFHAATAATLTSYEINQIWLAGTLFPPAESVNAIHAADRFLATGLATSPTIAVTKGDHVEVTTSVFASSEFPEPGWATGEIVRVNTGFFGGIQATIGDNVQIETNGDKSITPEALIISALFVEPILSRQPAKATASLPMPNVYTAPNYFSLVMAHNPVFYIEDGQPEPVNYGSWEIDGWEREYVDTVQSGLEMNAVGNQKSWIGNSQGVTLHEPHLQANVPNYQTKINDLYASRNLTIEAWYTSVGKGSTVNRLDYIESGPIFNDGITQITEVWDFFGCVPGSDPQLKIMLIAERIKNYGASFDDSFAVWRSYPDANPKKDQWNHLVVTYEPVPNPQEIRRKIYLNSALVGNELLTISTSSENQTTSAFTDEKFIDITLNQPQNIFQGPVLGGGIQLSGSQEIKWQDGVKKDEFAIYPKALSGTQVVEHYNFIRSLSPDAFYNATATDFLVQIGNHQVLPVQNALYDEDPMPALAARIPEPVIIGGKSKDLSFDSAEASAEIVDPSIQTESILFVDPMLTIGELLLPSISNNYYYQYVQSNIAPYRYVSFDTNNEIEDHGTDNDYSVAATTIYGTVTEYKDGINNKSIKTFGNSYTNGVVLNESEWNDSWGTGQNSYHSAFWFERAEDDASTTGLRVLWNLNGYKDNQHVVLYQYQGKLHMQFNNGSGTWIEQDTGTLDLFDYQRHFVVIEFDHTNANNNTVRVYVDAILRSTINLGAYTGSTTNATTADSGPNIELNNHPRLGVGCLITPLEATALPVVPTNTKLIIDEVYWDKNSITSTMVTNLYNAMPIKTKYKNYATPLTATALIVEPTISTSTTFTAESMLAFPAQTEPTITTVYSISIQTDTMDATADINDAVRSDSINIVSDLFLATFALGSSGTPRIINATPLTASLALVNRTVTGIQTGQGNGISINGQRTFDPNSKWVQYVVSTKENTLIPMREVR